jgi:Flp pilus assembly protein TadG
MLNTFRFCRSIPLKLTARRAGQAATEFAIAMTIMVIFLFAAIDFGRALNDMQVMADLTRQGCNLASRGTALGGNTGAVAAVVQGESNLDLANLGDVIITQVKNEGGTLTVAAQDSSTSDGTTNLKATSKIGAVGATATLPSSYTTANIPVGQSLYVTEIFYTYNALTPIGAVTKNVINLPTTLYDAAYF